MGSVERGSDDAGNWSTLSRCEKPFCGGLFRPSSRMWIENCLGSSFMSRRRSTMIVSSGVIVVTDFPPNEKLGSRGVLHPMNRHFLPCIDECHNVSSCW